MTINRFGLARDIPSHVKGRVRRRCGFGCVVCGNAIHTFEHFDPPFRDATEHRDEGITLLCGSHQLESSKGLLSRDSIRRANAHPCCLRRGYAAYVLDLGNERPRLVIGGSDVTNCGSGLAFNGQWVLRVREPDDHSTRWRLSARFFGADGASVCAIRDNELIVPAANYDVEQAARTLIVRRDSDVVLELELLPPATLAVNRYTIPTSSGVIFIGRRNVPDPFTPGESVRSVIAFEGNGGVQMFVDCAFSADLGLNFSVTGAGLIMQNQVISELEFN